ncbi:DEAD/DEAH box helicase [Shewanella zhangzhouensis]|uniref:DEAD/DEAH box helicase n=1 Tax=Shewanella zhangzhouensis TaxID=2864213 RepID=UPI001C656520|nr:DEAD/DEAH box helicase [Shewanella zhangzhouensis]QYK04117.1 DEAD/DEAH box helicase [Shewanella zhangzhouensis]
MSFDSLGLAAPLLQTLKQCGYPAPTEIQAQSIPVLLSGRDLIAVAQTGSGKTAAFALPILQQISNKGQRGGIQALVLVPTRELAVQVADAFTRYSAGLGLTALAVYGGVNIRPQRQALAAGVDILVATPGRLLDLTGQFGLSLASVSTLVLDEADRMLDMGFAPDIEKIRRQLGQHQSAMFSASFAERERELAGRWLANAVSLAAKDTGRIPQQLALEVFMLDKPRWAEFVAELVGKRNWRQALVFVSSREESNTLVAELALDGLQAAAFHGEKTQGARRRGLDEFKSGKQRLLVATDVAARGLDIEDLPVVISLGLPHGEEDLIHRLGRSARAGREGLAVIVLSPEMRADLPLLKALCPALPEVITPEGYSAKDPLPQRYRDSALSTSGSKPANKSGRHAGHRPGSRDGNRSGSRTGSRTAGGRAGSSNGSQRQSGKPARQGSGPKRQARD